MTALPAGLDAVRRPRARLVRRPDLERLRRQDARSAAWPRPASARSPRRASSAAGSCSTWPATAARSPRRRPRRSPTRTSMACAKAQGAEIQTTRHPRSSAPAGSPSSTRSAARSSTANFVEPGLTYSPELVQWFHDMEIPNLVDRHDRQRGHRRPRVRRGAAAAQRADAQPRRDAHRDLLARRPRRRLRRRRPYTFLYVAAPLKVVSGHRLAGEPGRRSSRSAMGLRRAAPGSPRYDDRAGPPTSSIEYDSALAMFAGDRRSAPATAR